jgi:hypothetical protein
VQEGREKRKREKNRRKEDREKKKERKERESKLKERKGKGRSLKAGKKEKEKVMVRPDNMRVCEEENRGKPLP